MDIDYKAIGAKVKYFRKIAVLKQEKLAESINVEASTISHIERGTTKVSLPTLIKLANALHVSLDELVYDNLEKNRHITVKIINDLLQDCNDKEIADIAEIIAVSKNILRKYN